MAAKKKGLGRGLEALMGGIAAVPVKKQTAATANQTAADLSEARNQKPGVPAAGSIDTTGQSSAAQVPGSKADTSVAASAADSLANRVLQVPVELCQRGRYQPRRAIDSEALEELAQSIRSQGVMQPVILRELSAAEQKGGVRYEIVAGERRWRAAQLAGLNEVPGIVRQLDDETASAMALIENLQREDLNPMDEAQALARLQEDFNLTHQQIADLVGKSRTAISNTLRLLNLHEKVQQLLENGDLEMGHARALLALPKEQHAELARDVVNRSLSVRQVEALVRRQQGAGKKSAKGKSADAPVDANTLQLQNELSDKLGVPVQIQHKRSGSGQLLLKYHSLDELDGILERIH
ncbi:MAG: ParB/RepB/Spo0J family partition protein [Pseudomonadales bacterium]